MWLKPLPYRIIQCKLEVAGFVVVSQKGSHVKFSQTTSEGTLTAIVPHYKEVSVGTIRSILRQAGLTPDEFENL